MTTLRALVEEIARARGWKSAPDAGGYAIDVPQGKSGRRQAVRADEFRDGDELMARFTTRIGKIDKLDARRLRSALELNFRLPHGCLAVDGDHLVMTDTRPLRTTTPETSGDVIDFIARQADAYEKMIYRTDIH